MMWAGMFFAAIATRGMAQSVAAQAAPTFNRDIAPIVFRECVTCHYPGGTAPFSLINYRDLKKRTKQIRQVVTDRQMPPWLPEKGHGDFVGERRLTEEQVALFERWVAAGAPEGRAEDLPAKPARRNDWALGKPDLVVTLPQAYAVPAEGKDIYRNFVIPKIVPGDRYLRAIEFRPGETAAIHHAFVLLDHTGGARRRAARETEPGFPGMNVAGAGSPDAMFMSWQPGKRPSEAAPGTAAILHENTDVVLQLHMRPTGKSEKVQPSVGLYFSEAPPTREAYILLLRSVDFEIPAGASDHVVETSYKVPVDVEMHSILPHMHYLGKEAHGWAELPDGTQRELILIKHWDFNWQGDYRYAEPISLPKGSVLRMRYRFDNSAANPRNPNQPPKAVRYGPQSADEMCELWFQLIPRKAEDYAALVQDYYRGYGLTDAIAWGAAMVRHDPKDAQSRTELGAALAGAGRIPEATQALEQAIADDPVITRAHHLLGQIFLQQRNGPKAKASLTRAIELDPQNFKARNDLGVVLLATGEAGAALEQFEQALKISPGDPIAREGVKRAQNKLRKP